MFVMSVLSKMFGTQKLKEGRKEDATGGFGVGRICISLSAQRTV